ncbi:MAG: PadR family transcriptional regulator [Anaerovoracaceae bacterium]|jgi:DNA-binding PadR family transcriptional regulator
MDVKIEKSKKYKMDKGSMEMISLLLLTEGDKSGSELIEQIKKLSGNVVDVAAGTLYPSLYGLADHGYILEDDKNK